MCSCEEGEQSVDHILYECKLLDHGRDRLKTAVIRSENWPVSKDKLSTVIPRLTSDPANEFFG